MKLFIANCTRQLQICNFWLAEVRRPISLPIEAGQQQMVSRNDLNRKDVEGVIEQMRRYGLMTVDESGNPSPRDGQIPFLASTDAPVAAAVIHKVMMHNQGVLTLSGKEMREQAAVAVSQSMDQMAHTPNAAANVEMTIQQETDNSDGTEPVAEGYRIDPQAQTRNEGSSRGKRGRR